jgi:hypothetical protein
MKDSTNTLSQISDSSSTQGSILSNLKTTGTIVVGTVLVSYFVIKSMSDWILGNPNPTRSRKNKNGANRLSSTSKKRRRDIYNGNHDELDSNESGSVKKGRFGNRKVMSYISEEGSDVESIIHEDLLIPIYEDDATSITYSERRPRNIYLNSNDELQENNQEDETPSHWYMPVTKENIKNKLYRHREVEAAKFINSIDHAVHQFKHQRVKNYENFKIDLNQNKEARYTNSKLKDAKDKNAQEVTQLNSLAEKYKAEVKQLTPKTRKNKLKDIDEHSVRLNDCLGKQNLDKKVT